MNQRPSIKVSGENIEVNVYVLGFGNGFLDMTPKAQTKTPTKKIN
jgi:hypothetical protein